MSVEVTKDTFEAEVLENDQTVFVYYWANWSNPCRSIATPMFDELEAEYPEMKFCKIDTQKQAALARQQKVNNVPVFAIYEKGTETKRLIGQRPKDAVVDWLKG